MRNEITLLFDQEFIINILNILFLQSVEEQNFRYTGARLCRLLDGLNPSCESMFRTLLCRKLEYNDGEIAQFINNETHKVRNTILFLAELYIQLQNVNKYFSQFLQNFAFFIFS